MKKAYISGMITGLPYEQAEQSFKDGAIQVSELGYEPVNPMAIVPYNPNWAWKDYMVKDIDLLFDCEVIYMLKNWGHSKGARIEHAIAQHCGMQIIYQ